MQSFDPQSWKPPSWHSDFGNANFELEMLRTFAIELLNRVQDIGVQLNYIEQGYMCVEIQKDLSTFAEVYIVKRKPDSGIQSYGLFIETDGLDEELYFDEPKQVVEHLLHLLT